MARKRLVTTTPATWLGSLAEAAFGTCGRSVIIDGAWYRFRHGRGLVVSRAEVAETRPELCIVDAGESDEGPALARLIGTRWSLASNCLTVFSPFWRSDMSQVSTGDRQAISRSVVLSMLVATALATAGVIGVNWWIDTKLQRLIDRQDAHYRSVVTHLGQIKARLPE